MKLSLSILMILCLTLVLNTISYGASYSAVIGGPNQETTVEKENLISKAKQFVQKQIIKKVKNYFRGFKDSWNAYKKAKEDKEGGIIGLAIIFLLLATTTLVVLKILEVIAWSWLWILAPLWISIGFFLLVFALAFIYFLIKGKK
ncbi:MAG: Flp pilus assembly protein TadB [Cognaticolwellia sp.]|jgi:Flp pilus assembly protein TadB